MDVLLLMNIFPLYPAVKFYYGHNSDDKNEVLGACRFCDARPSLRDVDQESKFGGIIGFWDF